MYLLCCLCSLVYCWLLQQACTEHHLTFSRLQFVLPGTTATPKAKRFTSKREGAPDWLMAHSILDQSPCHEIKFIDKIAAMESYWPHCNLAHASTVCVAFSFPQDYSLSGICNGYVDVMVQVSWRDVCTSTMFTDWNWNSHHNHYYTRLDQGGEGGGDANWNWLDLCKSFETS
jgi:hypothetical protein